MKRRWRLALAGAILLLLFLVCAYALRGTFLLPINTHLQVRFIEARMAVESASIPRVNGVYLEISNSTKEQHQLAVLHEGIPYRTKGFIEEWQPFHRNAGQSIEPGQKVSYQGIFVYEAPLKTGSRFLLFCNEPGHYARGGHAELVVK
jgi:hypothetical protein